MYRRGGDRYHALDEFKLALAEGVGPWRNNLALRNQAIQIMTTPGVEPGSPFPCGADKIESIGDLRPLRVNPDGKSVRVITPGVIQERAIPSGELLGEEPNSPEKEGPAPAVRLPEGLKLLGNSEDGKWAVVAPSEAGGANRRLALWDAAGGRQVEELDGVALPLPDHVKTSPDGRRMAYVDSETGETIKVYDWTRKRYLCSVPIGRHALAGDLWTQAGFSPDGSLLAFRGSANGEWGLRLYDVDHGMAAGMLTDGPVNSSAWSRDGRWLITAVPVINSVPGDNNRIRTHVRFNEVFYPTPTYPIRAVGSGDWCPVRFLHNGAQLAAAETLWDVTPGEKRTALKSKAGDAARRRLAACRRCRRLGLAAQAVARRRCGFHPPATRRPRTGRRVQASRFHGPGAYETTAPCPCRACAKRP